MTLVYYKGKKKNLHLKMPWLTQEYRFKTKGSQEKMADVDAERLLRENPNAFGKITVQEKPEEMAPEKVVPEEIVATPIVEPEITTKSLADLPKYPSQMNKEQLVEYAKVKHAVDLDIQKTRMDLYGEVAELDAGKAA